MLPTRKIHFVKYFCVNPQLFRGTSVVPPHLHRLFQFCIFATVVVCHLLAMSLDESLIFMAKSSSFFGLRRGSTKSLTFQVVDGKQVTKDRVTFVKNPRSYAQATQRSKMAAVADAYRALSTICDHSFESVPYGPASRREFMSLNLARSIKPEPKGFCLPIGVGLQVSKGTLEQFNVLDFKLFPNKAGVTGSYPLDAAWVNLVLAQSPNLQAGDELTYVSCALDGINMVDVNGASMPNVKYAIASIVLDPNSAINAEWSYDSAKSKFLHSSGLSMEVGDPSFNVADADVIASGVIVSRYADGKWRRSTCILNEMGDMAASGYTDAYFDACIASYMDAPSVAESKKQLNKATSK